MVHLRNDPNTRFNHAVCFMARGAPAGDWTVTLIGEDIVDTGLTLRYLQETLQGRNPRSLEVCALLSKREARVVEVPVKYVGFEIPNEFVVGYGLDYQQRYRGLPYVGVLNPAS